MNGQAKIDFEKWYNETIGKEINVGHLSLYTLSSTMINSVKIDFFDSVGIYIHIEPYTYNYRGLEEKASFKNYIVNNTCIDEQNSYTSRQQATEKALEKAVELYNLKI